MTTHQDPAQTASSQPSAGHGMKSIRNSVEDDPG